MQTITIMLSLHYLRSFEAGTSVTKVTIGFRTRSALGKTIEFLPWRRRKGSGTHPAVRELRALCKQANAGYGLDQASPFDPTEKIFGDGDDCVQVGKDYILQGCEGKDEVCEKDRFFFKDLARISVVRSKKSGRITAIHYKVKRKSGTFEIGGYKPGEMEEIAGLLETRVKGLPIQFVEKRSDFHLWDYVACAIALACVIVLIIIGIATCRVLFGR